MRLRMIWHFSWVLGTFFRKLRCRLIFYREELLSTPSAAVELLTSAQESLINDFSRHRCLVGGDCRHQVTNKCFLLFAQVYRCPIRIFLIQCPNALKRLSVSSTRFMYWSVSGSFSHPKVRLSASVTFPAIVSEIFTRCPAWVVIRLWHQNSSRGIRCSEGYHRSCF